MENLLKIYKNKFITYFVFTYLLSVFLLLYFQYNVFADEFDSKEVSQKMYNTGAYDIWLENKIEYPYYIFSDYSIYNTDTSHTPPGERHRSYTLFLFDKKPIDGVELINQESLTYRMQFAEPVKYKNYIYNNDDGEGLSYKVNYSGSGKTKVQFASVSVIGTNFNIMNSDGSFFFGLTSRNPTLTTSSIKRTLMKPIVYLIPLLAGLVILVVAFRKAWIMLKMLLVGA